MARRSAGIRDVADLSGKRVAVTKNTSAEYFLAEMLGAARLKESDVTLVPLEGEAMPAALAKPDVDAIAIWEPHAQNASDRLGGEAVVLEDPSVYGERFNLNSTVRVLRDPAKRRALVRLVRAVIRVSAQLEQSPHDFTPALAQVLATPEAVIAKVWGQFRFPAALDEPQLRLVLEDMEPWAAAITRRPPRPRATLVTLIESDILAEARQ